MIEDPRGLEERSLNAWPSLYQLVYDGWLLRFAKGYTRRANSVVPLYKGQLDMRQKVETCRENYTRYELPCVFKILPTASNLDKILAEQGFEFSAETSVQTCDLKTLSRHHRPELQPSRVGVKQWVDDYARLSTVGEVDRKNLQAIIDQITLPTLYLRLCCEGKVVSCGMGIVDRGYVGIYSLVTAQAFRGRGFAQRLIADVAGWAVEEGAERAYLQVMPENQVASGLYKKLGFAECYRYWYRIVSSK